MQAYLIASHFVYQKDQVKVWEGLAMRENKFVGVNEEPAFLGLYSSHLRVVVQSLQTKVQPTI
jgi:hypothetical protein